jgi:hypothetical protein
LRAEVKTLVVYHPNLMTARRDSAPTPIAPLAIVGVLAIGWPLPLAWASLVLATVTLVALLVVTLTRAIRSTAAPAVNDTSTAAACCLVGIGLVGLGYAAFALTGGGSLGGATRLGYPFLIATRLYLRGGLILLLLCAVVGSVPLLFER